MELLTKLNEYFFDIDEGDSMDWQAVVLFYGVCSMGVIMAAALLALLIVG